MRHRPSKPSGAMTSERIKKSGNGFLGRSGKMNRRRASWQAFLIYRCRISFPPPILFFILGLFASRVRSDLEIPPAVGKALSYYLLLVIGFKGGVELSVSELNLKLLNSMLAALFVGAALPFIAYPLLRIMVRLDRLNAAAISAHYGSISVVTFVAAAAFLGIFNIPYEGYVVAMMALMEAPAIITGLFLAKGGQGRKIFSPDLVREVFFGGTLLLLLGSFCIGWLTGERGMEAMTGFVAAPFTGVLCFFLLEMGILAGKRLEVIKKAGLPLVLFGIYMPLIGGALGITTGAIIGLSQGGTNLLAVLCASASYIVVPAALRHSLPEANPALSMPLALGVTFPFNIFFGIPLYFYGAKMVYEIL